MTFQAPGQAHREQQHGRAVRVRAQAHPVPEPQQRRVQRRRLARLARVRLARISRTARRLPGVADAVSQLDERRGRVALVGAGGL